MARFRRARCKWRRATVFEGEFRGRAAPAIDILGKGFIIVAGMPSYISLSDDELISKCLDHDARAWEVLVRRQERLIASIAYKFKLTNADASDVFQAVCLTLFQQLPQVRNRGKLSSWVITVAVRECWKLRQRQSRTDSLDDPDWAEAVDPANEDHLLMQASVLQLEEQQLLRRALETLPERCQRLLTELFYAAEPKPYTELSTLLGLPVPSIGPTRARCLAKLKESLEKNGFF